MARIVFTVKCYRGIEIQSVETRSLTDLEAERLFGDGPIIEKKIQMIRDKIWAKQIQYFRKIQ